MLIYYKFELIRLAALKLQKFGDFLVLSEFIFEVLASLAVSSVTDGYSISLIKTGGDLNAFFN